MRDELAGHVLSLLSLSLAHPIYLSTLSSYFRLLVNFQSFCLCLLRVDKLSVYPNGCWHMRRIVIRKSTGNQAEPSSR